MNPVPLLALAFVACVLGVGLRTLVGMSWPASLGTGVVTTPLLLWAFAKLLDRVERGAEPADHVAREDPGASLVGEPAPPCPRCGASGAAEIL